MRSTFGGRTRTSFGGRSAEEITAADSSDDCFDDKPLTQAELDAQEAQLKKVQKTEDHPTLKIAKKFTGSWKKCVEQADGGEKWVEFEKRLRKLDEGVADAWGKNKEDIDEAEIALLDILDHDRLARVVRHCIRATKVKKVGAL